jgi:hypothetical protein
MKLKKTESIKMPLDESGIHNLFYILKLNIAQSIFAYFLSPLVLDYLRLRKNLSPFFVQIVRETEHREWRKEFVILKFSLILMLCRVGIFICG